MHFISDKTKHTEKLSKISKWKLIVTYLWKIISIGFQCIVLLSGSYFSTHKEYLCSFLALIPPNQVSVFTCGSSQEYHLQTSGQRACCLPCLCPRCSDHLHLCSEVLYSSWRHAWQTAAASQTSMLKAHCWMTYFQESVMNFWSPFKKCKTRIKQC